MTERAELMGIYRSNGISSISLMRDHYNKYDDGGDIQPSDATFRATLTNPVNSYRSNAPAGIGDAAITKATGLLNPITAATLTATPLGAISKINAAAKAYKAAKMANPIIASTIGASSTSAGLAGYLDSRPDKKLSRDIEDKNYVGVASDLAEGVTEGLTAISPLRVIDTKGVKKITRPLKKQLTRILRPGDIKVGDNKLSSREAAVRYLNNIDQYNVPYNSSNKEAFKIAPELEDYLIETKQSFSPEVVDKFIQRQGRMLRGVKASSPEEAITYFTNPSPKGFETTRGPGIYTSNSTDIAKQFSNRGYIGDLSLDFGITSNESPLEKLKRYKKALPQVDNAVSPASLETTRLMWSLREGDINQKEFINKARNTFGYKGIEGTYYYNSIPPKSERVLYESPKVNKVYEASTFNQTLPVKESDLFITQRGEGSVPYIFKRLQKENPSAVGEAIQQLTTLEQSRRDRIQEAARYYQNIQDRAKIGATVAGAGLGAYGIYKAIENKKAFGGNIYDGKSTKSNQMNPSSFKVDPENTSLLKVLQTQPNQPVDPSNSLNNLDSYRYQIPTYIEVENQKVPLVRYKTDLEKEMIPKISEEYYNRIEKDNIINPEFMRMEKNIENESKEGYKNGRWYPHLSPEGGAKTIGYGDKLVPSYEYKRDRAFIKRAHAEGISDEEANNRLNYNLKVSLDAVRKDIINKYGYEAWDTMYPSLKRGLTDIRFNVGPNKEYPKATEAAIRNNIEQFMKEQKDGRSPRRVDSINTLFIDQLKNL